MLVRKGRAQRLQLTTDDGQQLKVWPVATNHDDAQHLADWLDLAGVRPVLVGSIPGETLISHISAALKEGCQDIYVVAGWDSKGAPEWQSFRDDFRGVD